MSSLDFTAFIAALMAIVALVAFLGGRQWERELDLAPVTPPPAADRETAEMLGWVHEMGGEPARPALAPAPAGGPVCDCLIEGTGPRRGGAVLGCPKHDPERTHERRTALALSPPPRVPLPGPVRAYSALAAWRLEQETATPADTSVTKLTASIVRGMDYREQIDRYGADILAQLRRNLHGERAA